MPYYACKDKVPCSPPVHRPRVAVWPDAAIAGRPETDCYFAASGYRRANQRSQEVTMARTTSSAAAQRPAAAERPARRSRAEKSTEIREALFKAAAEIVGELGYAEASITRITSRANVAQGTFYNYFHSRQDLLDQLLPVLGRDMLAYIRDEVGHPASEREREDKRFRAFFNYLYHKPAFLRILNEALFFAPAGHHGHFDHIVKDYRHILGRAATGGEIQGYAPRELEVVVYILLAARNYLSERYSYRDGKVRPLPDWVADAYLKFVSGGLFGGADAHAPAITEAASSAPPAVTARPKRRPARRKTNGHAVGD